MTLRSKPLVISAISAVILAASVITVLLYMMSRQSTGTVHIGQPQSAQGESTTSGQSVPVSTTYFTTNMPAGFSVKSQTDTPSAPFLLQLEATSASIRDERIAITVGIMPTNGLSGVGDYNLRATESAVYQKAAPSNLPSGAVAFQTVGDPAGLAVFWPHGAQYAELAFSTSGGATYAQLESAYTNVLAQWNWK